jgi:hypothetical protein
MVKRHLENNISIERFQSRSKFLTTDFLEFEKLYLQLESDFKLQPLGTNSNNHSILW